MPLRVVLRGIADALDGHAHLRAATARSAASPTARRRWRRRASAGRRRWPWRRGRSGLDLPAVLRGLRARPRAARSASGRAASKAAEAAAAAATRTGGTGAGSRTSSAGSRAGGARASRRSATTRTLPTRLEPRRPRSRRTLAPYRERMPARVLEQIRRGLAGAPAAGASRPAAAEPLPPGLHRGGRRAHVPSGAALPATGSRSRSRRASIAAWAWRAHEGQVVFVPRGLPGDRLRVRVETVRPGYVEGRTEAIARRPRRSGAPSPCPYVAACGGCAYQELDYAAQLRLKEAVLRESLRRAGAPWEGDDRRPCLARGGLAHCAPRSTSSSSGRGRAGSACTRRARTAWWTSSAASSSRRP